MMSANAWSQHQRGAATHPALPRAASASSSRADRLSDSRPQSPGYLIRTESPPTLGNDLISIFPLQRTRCPSTPKGLCQQLSPDPSPSLNSEPFPGNSQEDPSAGVRGVGGFFVRSPSACATSAWSSCNRDRHSPDFSVDSNVSYPVLSPGHVCVYTRVCAHV
jgi:hypothetical protein